MKNPFNKKRKENEPYAIYEGGNGFEWRILKTYKSPESEAKDPYARWLVAATSNLMQGGGYESGDTYASEIKKYGRLVKADDTWLEHYTHKESWC
jgi:hypothetical protein|tara:strand:- start:361 stop:645 length:285 start_codon:yes stop_codon:yes gene_type:complete